MPSLISPQPSSSTLPLSPTRQWTAGTLLYTPPTLIILFIWLLLGDFALNMKERAINPIALVMLRHFSAPESIVGFLVGSIPAAIGLMLVPLISVQSDRFRSRWGRRIPFVLLPTPLIVLAMLCLATIPNIANYLLPRLQSLKLSPATCSIGLFAIFWTIFEVASIIANSLFGALINDVVPAELIGRFFGLFRAVSLVAGIIFNYWLMGKADAYFQLLLICLGLFYGLAMTAMCIKVREGQYPPPPPKEPGRSPLDMLLTVFAYLKECYGNPFFLAFFLATTLGGLTLAPVNTFAVYHARSVQMSDDLYGKCVAISYCVSLLLAYPLGILADRLHPLRLGFFFAAFYAAVTAYGYFFATNSTTFFIALALHTIISGCYITSTASIAQRLLPRARFARIASAGGIIGAFLGLFVAPSLGRFIEKVDHQYRYVFLLACALALLTCASYILLLRKYNSLGGDRAFTPPQ